MLSAWRKSVARLLAAALVVGGSATGALAADVDIYLRATDTLIDGTTPFVVTVPGGLDVPAAGFAQETGFAGLSTPAVDPTVPGPRIEVLEGDNVFIWLQSDLADPSSFVVHGLTQQMTPTMVDGRVMSFGKEAPAGNFTVYQYPNVKAGTYLYESGTYTQIQVPMGLYGALIVRPVTPGTAYGPGVDPGGLTAFDTEATLVFGELDPTLNAAVAGGAYGPGGAVTSTVDYAPKFFLINGSAYPDTYPQAIPGVVGQRLLLRLVNGGSETRVPTLNGLSMAVVARDGHVLPYAYQTYGPTLAAGQTLDVLVDLAAPGRYALFDQGFGLTNAGVAPGGMLTFIDVPFDAATGVTLTPDLPSPGAPGDTVVFTAAGQGGNGPYEYEFWFKGPATADRWTRVQDYGLGDNWTWSVTADDLATGLDATSRIAVRARIQGESTGFDAKMGLDYLVQTPTTGPASAVTLAGVPDNTASIAAGTAVGLTAQAVGGAGPFEYEFWANRPAPNQTQWMVIAPYSPSATATWDTTGYSGTARVAVRVRTQGSTVVYEAKTGLDYTFTP